MKKFFYNLSMKFQKFMTGRYGMDQLFRALLIFYLIIIIIANIVYRYSKISYTALWIMSLVLIIFAFFRVFSKNIEARRSENATWLKFTWKFKQSARLTKDKLKQRKTHKFIKCKKCKKVLRLPKHKGKINVSCPHCHSQFIVNTGKKKTQQQ
ncbi:MAG: hypothetical protein ACI4IQ_06675 [Eubacterium sp.]